MTSSTRFSFSCAALAALASVSPAQQDGLVGSAGQLGGAKTGSARCPVTGLLSTLTGGGHPASNPRASTTAKAASTPIQSSVRDWRPNQLNLSVLHRNSPAGNPMGGGFDYAAEFAKLDLDALKKDIEKALTTSQDWWPADYGHYGGLMIRLAWHSAGTYRTSDGRGGSGSGTIRFAPLNGWPDNGNLDKARRLLWPIKQKYGRKISWADLIVLSGNVALESMGFETFGFAGGREDVWEPQPVDWGPEAEMLTSQRFSKDRELDEMLGASEMGLIYVNPQGPDGEPDPVAAARDIRITFGRMGMNDEETVALIAGGHTLGKAHGAAAGKHIGAEPNSAPLEQQGLGWKNSHGRGNAQDTITSGLEGAWTYTPDQWSHDFFTNLMEYDWKLIKGAGGAWQWRPVDGATKRRTPDAHVPGKEHHVMMLTTDLSLKEDPVYRKISQRFYENPEEFDAAFARAWFKLTHRDMGSHARLLGPEVPEPQLWQDPVPRVDHELISQSDVGELKRKILASGLTVPQLVSTAWSAASSYRDSDKRGGINGARLRLAPQKDWTANQPVELTKVLAGLERVRAEFNSAQTGNKKVSLADMIVLGGDAAVEHAAEQAGHAIELEFRPGRTDATEAMTDAASFDVLEPIADGFRNFLSDRANRPAPELLVDRASQLALSAPEMTVLLGGLRVLGADYGKSKAGVLTERPGVLSNDYFVNLLSMKTAWQPSGGDLYEGRDRESGAPKWTATSVDLVFGAHAQLRALAEVYASADAKQKFVEDFARVWSKVMHLDRFDL